MFDRADLKGRMTMLNDMRETIGARPQVPRLQPQHPRRSGAGRGPRRRPALEEEPGQVRERAVQDRARLRRVPARPRLQRRHPPGPGGERGHRLRRARARAARSPATTWSSPRRPRPSALAHAFINFLHDPAVAAENTDFIQYLCPNKDAYALMSRGHQEQPGHLPGPRDQGQERGHRRPGRGQRQVRQGLGRDQGGQVAGPAGGPGGVAPGPGNS